MAYVDLTQFFPLTFLIHLVRVIIIFNVVHQVLEDKYNTFVTFLSMVVSGMVFSYIFLPIANEKNEIIILLVYYLVLFAVLFFVTNASLFARVISMVFSLVTYTLSSLASSSALSMFGINISNAFNYKVPTIIYISNLLFTFSFSFIFVILIKVIKSKSKSGFKYGLKYTLFLIFPFTHIFSALQLMNIYRVTEQSSDRAAFFKSSKTDYLMIAFSLICLIIDFSIIFFIDSFEKTEEKNIENEKALLKSALDYEQIQMFNEEKREFIKIKHDLNNIITTAQGFIEIGKPDKALEIFKSTNNSLAGISGFSVCSNDTINTVLYIKQKEANKFGIKFEAEIDETYPLSISDFDLARLLGNVIDNAINASKKVEGEKIIKLNLSVSPSGLDISVKNRFNKKAEKSKKRDINHGNGLLIVKEISAFYQGTYNVIKDEDIWCVEISIPNVKNAITA